jgi:hypothetical protein
MTSVLCRRFLFFREEKIYNAKKGENLFYFQELVFGYFNFQYLPQFLQSTFQNTAYELVFVCAIIQNCIYVLIATKFTWPHSITEFN